MQCANTNQVTDKLILMTTQLLDANFFTNNNSLLQQVLRQINTPRAVPTSAALSLPLSASAPAMASAATSKSAIVKQQCTACCRVTDHGKRVYRTKCPSRAELLTQTPTSKPKAKKPRQSKRKPREYAVYTCLSDGCGAEYSSCPTTKDHPLLQWTPTDIPGNNNMTPNEKRI